jgi:hypothetical protein
MNQWSGWFWQIEGDFLLEKYWLMESCLISRGSEANIKAFTD